MTSIITINECLVVNLFSFDTIKNGLHIITLLIISDESVQPEIIYFKGRRGVVVLINTLD